uniref:Uncharacterized protein n=1 Tax=Fagus sylvatica TaxID=28930 RepID=A0A2N9GNF0_FAGSY
MITADSVVTGVVWPGESSSSKQDKFAVAVNQGVGHGFSMSQSGEADGGTLGSSRDNSDKSDDNEIEGEIMEITEDMVPAEAKRVKRLISLGVKSIGHQWICLGR